MKKTEDRAMDDMVHEVKRGNTRRIAWTIGGVLVVLMLVVAVTMGFRG